MHVARMSQWTIAVRPHPRQNLVRSFRVFSPPLLIATSHPRYNCTQRWQAPDLWVGSNPNTTHAAMGAYFNKLHRAWVLLARSADECDTDAARFDVVDVGRESLPG